MGLVLAGWVFFPLCLFVYMYCFFYFQFAYSLLTIKNAYSLTTATFYISRLMCFGFHITKDFHNWSVRGGISILQRGGLNSCGLDAAETAQWVGVCVKL